MFEQLLLGPSDQRRDQQPGQAEIVERLRGEAQRRHQVLDRQRRAEPQPVDPGHRHARSVEPRDDQARQVRVACAPEP